MITPRDNFGDMMMDMFFIDCLVDLISAIFESID